MCIRDRQEPEAGLKKFVEEMWNANDREVFAPMKAFGDTAVSYTHLDVYKRQADGTMLETAWESRWMPDYMGL